MFFYNIINKRQSPQSGWPISLGQMPSPHSSKYREGFCYVTDKSNKGDYKRRDYGAGLFSRTIF